MSNKYSQPQAFSKAKRPHISLHGVKSSQVKSIGYDPDTKTLAVSFNGGSGAIYHYPNVSPETYHAFKSADSIGTYFGKHIKSLPFTKFPGSEA